MPTYSVTINDVERDCLIESFDLRDAVNRAPVLSGEFLWPDGSFVPAVGDEIVAAENGTAIFGGVILSADTEGSGGPAVAAISTRVNAVGFASYADRRYVNETLAAGTLKSQLTTLVAYLTDYGVSLDGSQVDGPDMPAMDCEYRKLTDVLNDLSRLTAGAGGSPTAPPYAWEIDATKTLRMFQMGSVDATVDLIEGDGTEVGDVIVTRTNRGYANRVILRSGGGARVTVADDEDEQSDRGVWEMLVDTPAPLSDDVATRAAAGLLAQARDQTEIRYDTLATGLRPGLAQTITSAKRNVNGAFVLTDVTFRWQPNGTGLRRAVTAVDAGMLRGSWRDVLARWSTGVGGVGVVGSGGTGGFGGSVGGGVSSGGSGGVSCCDRLQAGDLVFSGFGDAPIKAYGPEGRARVLTVAPQLGEGGCNGFMQLAAAGAGCFVASGVVTALGNSCLVLNQDFTPRVEVSDGQFGMSVDASGRAYLLSTLHSGGNWQTRIDRIDKDGTVLDSWIVASDPVLGVGDRRGVAVNRAGTIAYTWGNRGTEIFAWDLVTDVSLGSFATASGRTLLFNAVTVLANDRLVAGWQGSFSPAPATGLVRVYAPDGSTVMDVTPSGAGFAPICVVPGNANGTTFWVSAYTSDAATYSGVRVEQYETNIGACVNLFDPEDGTFAFDGPFCCANIV